MPMTQALAEPTTERMARCALSLNEAGVAAEEILIAWLVGLPGDADIAREATHLVTRLDAAEMPARADERLRDLLLEVAQADAARMGNRNRSRNRWRN